MDRGNSINGCRRTRILIADDDAAVRWFLGTVLFEAGYDVLEAGDGIEAMKCARRGHVDIVITDLVMPEQEGLETIQTLRRELPRIGIIAISGAFCGQFLRPALMLGANAALAKPVRPADLLTIVRQIESHLFTAERK